MPWQIATNGAANWARQALHRADPEAILFFFSFFVLESKGLCYAALHCTALHYSTLHVTPRFGLVCVSA
jgi:hypothetical protein